MHLVELTDKIAGYNVQVHPEPITCCTVWENVQMRIYHVPKLRWRKLSVFKILLYD